MPTAHIVHGFLGAGKTTFAKELERSLPAMRFSHDECVSRLFGDNPPVETFWKHVEDVKVMLEGYWLRALELGLDVVLDNGFWRRKGRDDLRALITSRGADYKLYRLNCPEEVAWARIEKRNEDLQGSLLISQNTFAMLKSRFEPLGADEPCIEVSHCVT